MLTRPPRIDAGDLVLGAVLLSLLVYVTWPRELCAQVFAVLAAHWL